MRVLITQMGLVQIAVRPPVKIVREDFPACQVCIDVINSYLQHQKPGKIHDTKAQIGLCGRPESASSSYHTIQSTVPSL